MPLEPDKTWDRLMLNGNSLRKYIKYAAMNYSLENVISLLMMRDILNQRYADQSQATQRFINTFCLENSPFSINISSDLRGKLMPSSSLSAMSGLLVNQNTYLEEAYSQIIKVSRATLAQWVIDGNPGPVVEGNALKIWNQMHQSCKQVHIQAGRFFT